MGSCIRRIPVAGTGLLLLLVSDMARACRIAEDSGPKTIPLARLMSEADLIAIGSVDTDYTWTGLPFRVGDMRVTDIEQVRIERVLAAAWTPAETEDRIVRTGEAGRSLFVVERPHTTVFREAILLYGNRYLLWLARVEMPRERARSEGVAASACYGVLRGRRGVVSLTDPMDAIRRDPVLVKVVGDVDLLAHQKALLRRTFGDDDPFAAVAAADAFAHALTRGAPTEERLNALAQSASPAYRGTANELLAKEGLRRFRHREEPDPDGRDEKGKKAADAPMGEGNEASGPHEGKGSTVSAEEERERTVPGPGHGPAPAEEQKHESRLTPPFRPREPRPP
jgi:hypothetical protein